MSAAPEHLRHARETYYLQQAHRAIDDPIKLNRAKRMVQAALARELITIDDLTPLPDPNGSAE